VPDFPHFVGLGPIASADARVGVPEARPVWHLEGQRIWFLATDGASTHVFSVGITSAQSSPRAHAEPPLLAPVDCIDHS